MMQKEFEERTGMQVTPAEYEKIEKLYMNSGNIDKDTFCKEYKKIASSEIVKELQMSLRIAENKIQQKDTQIAAYKRDLDGAAKFIMEAEEYGCKSEAARGKAIELLGQKDYLTRKLQRGYKLTEADRKILAEMMENINY